MHEQLKQFNKGYTLVEIQGESCANCITMMPIIHNVASQFDNVSVMTLQACKENEFILEHYDVEGLPTVLFLHNQELIGKVKGLQPEEILTFWVESKIEEFEKNKK